MEHAAEPAAILLPLFIAFAGAKIAAEIMERLTIPPVVGELGIGILLGPSLLGWVEPDQIMLFLAEFGVIVLLFQVGLETHPSELRKVGGPAMAVGVLGVILPFVGGFVAGELNGFPRIESAFVATALVATSVGITARVLTDLGRLTRSSSRVILGAAVIDDILGLIVLTVVVGLSAGSLTAGGVVLLVVEALAFVGFLLFAGPPIMDRIAHLIEWPKFPRAPFAASILILLGLSAAAERIGLAAIVGAFLAGSVLSGTRDRYQLETQIRPVADLLTPFFFVVTGTRIDVGAFAKPSVLGFAAVITVIAILGKLIGGYLGSISLGKRAAVIVGVGMVPRGEVGIIVASIALNEGIVGLEVFGAVLLMVVVTTLLPPPFLKALFAGEEKAGAEATSS